MCYANPFYPLLLIWSLLLVATILFYLFFPITRDRLIVKGSKLILALFFTIVIFIAGTFVAATMADIDPLLMLNEDLANNDDNTLIWTILYHFLDPGNQHMSTYEPASRLMVLVLSIAGLVMLNGLLVSAIFQAFENRKGKWLKGEVRYRRWSLHNHIVIIGGSEMVSHIIKHYCTRKKNGKLRLNKRILILTKLDTEEFRRELISSLGFDSWKIVIYYGKRDSNDDIESLNVRYADEVYVLGEDPSFDNTETYHDTINMEAVQLISQAAAKRKNKLLCHVTFEYQTTFAALQISDRSKDIIEFAPINYYAHWCQKIFCGRANNYEKELPKEAHNNALPKRKNKEKVENEETIYYLPLDGAGIKEKDETYVHLVIVGMSRMGVALGTTAAHIAHYPNFSAEKPIRTRITFIDTNAEQEKDFVMGRYSSLFNIVRHRYLNCKERDLDYTYRYLTDSWINEVIGMRHLCKNNEDNFLDVEFEFINGDIESESIKTLLKHICSRDNARVTLAFCNQETNIALAHALYLPNEIYESDNVLQILIYQRKNSVVVDDINNSNKRYHKKLRAMGMVSDGYDFKLQEDIQIIAKATNSAYDSYFYETLGKYFADIRRDAEKLMLLDKINNSYIENEKTKRRTEQQTEQETLKEIATSYSIELNRIFALPIFDDYFVALEEAIKQNAHNDINKIVKYISKVISTIIDKKSCKDIGRIIEELKCSKDEQLVIKEFYKDILVGITEETDKHIDEIIVNIVEQTADLRNSQKIDGRIAKITERINEIIASVIEKKIKENTPIVVSQYNNDSDKMPWQASDNCSAGKSNMSSFWSNHYHCLSMHTKFRCLGFNPLAGWCDSSKGDFDEDQLSILARVEHNRWNVEQLLLGYSPLSAEEQELAKIVIPTSRQEERHRDGSLEKKKQKGMYKHLDICSYDRLSEVDDIVKPIDREMVKVLPKAYRDKKQRQKEMQKRCRLSFTLPTRHRREESIAELIKRYNTNASTSKPTAKN